MEKTDSDTEKAQATLEVAKNAKERALRGAEAIAAVMDLLGSDPKRHIIAPAIVKVLGLWDDSDGNTCTCSDFQFAQAAGASDEGYGRLITSCCGEWHLGSLTTGIKYCPWCGMRVPEVGK